MEVVASGGFPKRGVQARPKVDDPAEGAEGDEPKDGGADEEEEGGQKAALHELAETREEETAKRRDDIAGRTLSRCHGGNKDALRRLVYPANGRSRANQSTTSG